MTWRDNWFVKNVMAEIPIVGPFFTAKTFPQAMHLSGKSAAMLIGGTTAMALDLIPSNEEDSMALKMTKMTTNMAIGMAIANSVYNGLSEGGSMLHRYYVHKRSIPLSPPSEQLQKELLPISTTSAPRSDSDGSASPATL
jgi:hypothetical protein